MKEKIIVFDMDGTIVDLYGVAGWLDDLKNLNIRPYKIAKPLVNMNELNSILNLLKNIGFKIIITSWLSKITNVDYDNRVSKEKIDWLNKYDFPYDEINIVPYGTPKQQVTRKYKSYQILVDDNKEVRQAWNLGETIDANKDIIKELKKYLKTIDR